MENSYIEFEARTSTDQHGLARTSRTSRTACMKGWMNAPHGDRPTARTRARGRTGDQRAKGEEVKSSRGSLPNAKQGDWPSFVLLQTRPTNSLPYVRYLSLSGQ